MSEKTADVISPEESQEATELIDMKPSSNGPDGGRIGLYEDLHPSLVMQHGMDNSP